MAYEIEVKLVLKEGLSVIRRTLRGLEFRVTAARTLERNVLFDTAGLSLRSENKLIRMRQVKRRNILTYKGPPQSGRHKKREEIEFELPDAAKFEQILAGLGFHPAFRYEKYRTEYARAGDRGHVLLDETPIGDLLEIEGPAGWIDRTARELGFRRTDYVTRSYGDLYLEYCSARGLPPTDMLFSQLKTRRR